MLKDHKLFRFIPFPHKANDFIIFKNPNYVLGRFRPFLVIFPKILIFPNNLALSFLSPCGSNFRQTIKITIKRENVLQEDKPTDKTEFKCSCRIAGV